MKYYLEEIEIINSELKGKQKFDALINLNKRVVNDLSLSISNVKEMFDIINLSLKDL